VRTERTWLAYGALASYAYCLYGLGPVLAFLRSDLHLSYTVTNIHSTVWAAGTIVTGLSYPPLARRFGRRRVFWCAAAVFATGAALLVAGYLLAATLLAAAVLGTAGTTVLTGTTGILSDEHGLLRDRALIEANVGASATAVLAPAVIGGLASTAMGWRAGMAVPVVAFAALWLRFRRLRLPRAAGPAGPAGAGRLPGACWVALGLVAVVVGIEFCVVFDAALLLHSHAGLSTGHAAAGLSVFYAGELAGRLGGSQLARVPGRERLILGAALAVTAAGFAVFWAATQPGLALAGLGVAGLGIANLYPFSLALAMAAAAGRIDQAAGRSQLAVGSAVLTAPFALGALADRTGVVRAYLIEPGLIAAAAALVAAARATLRTPAP
jgi:predicted MFS family arabinose efflux permease